MKIKSILNNTFETDLVRLNSNLKENITSNGKFSFSFDIWTSNSNTAYMGVIVSYINSEFQLIYKLIGFKELKERHTGLILFEEFLKSIKSYPSITFNSIFRYITSILFIIYIIANYI